MNGSRPRFKMNPRISIAIFAAVALVLALIYFVGSGNSGVEQEAGSGHDSNSSSKVSFSSAGFDVDFDSLDQAASVSSPINPQVGPDSDDDGTGTSLPVPIGNERANEAIEFDSDDPGDQDTGSGVIAAYDYAYYVDRDPKRVARLHANDIDERGEESLKNAIEANPSGTDYRLKVVPVTPGEEYDVELTVLWPGHEPFVAKQKFFMTYSQSTEQFYILRVEQVS